MIVSDGLKIYYNGLSGSRNIVYLYGSQTVIAEHFKSILDLFQGEEYSYSPHEQTAQSYVPIPSQY